MGNASPDAHELPIQRDEDDRGGRYSVRREGHEAEMIYTFADDDVISIDHTGVPTPLRGRGIAKALVARGVDDARREGRRIIARCPFARAQIERHPEWRRMLVED